MLQIERVLLAATAVLLMSCQRQVAHAGGVAAAVRGPVSTPAATCYSDATVAGLAGALADLAATASPEHDAIAGAKLQLTKPLLASYDPTTKKATCSATLSLGAASAAPAGRWPIRYVVQPFADGRGVSYSFIEPGNEDLAVIGFYAAGGHIDAPEEAPGAAVSEQSSAAPDHSVDR